MDNLITLLHEWLSQFGLTPDYSKYAELGISLFAILILSYLADITTKKIIVSNLARYIRKSKNEWDDIFLEKKLFNRLSHLAPALVIHYSVEVVFKNYPGLIEFIQTCIYIAITIIIIMVINSFLKALNEIYQHFPISKNRSIKGYIQLINIIISIIGILLIYSFITGNPIKGILTGIGAMAAVLMLVFKDTILGLVASIQLSANNMVKIGDWITMPSHNADGKVLEISLNTVKVQNWDKTITTIPTYALVSDSFSNWRGMEESGGRRIKRSINIDMRSVKFCSKPLLEKLGRIHLLTDYINTKTIELENFNNENMIDNSILVNGQRLTNLGTFRIYIENYLKQHPKIHNDMTFMVRQLQPTPNGIPIEIYVFSKDQVWANYESLQCDIFDHILAIVPEFELQVFQNPTGSDFQNLLQ